MVACELPKVHPPEALRCPRCDSTDTKFCYYNNYNTSQPRHFCKSCKRYWTAGGTLRNVPVGGGLRKNKKCRLLTHVKDMISSSSSDELYHHGGLPAANSYVFPQDGFPCEAPRPLSYALPPFMPSPSSSADAHGDGTLASSYSFQNISPADFGYFGENRLDVDHAMSGMDPNSLDMRQHTQYHQNYSRALPLQQQGNGMIQGLHGQAGVDQAQSLSGAVSEAPSELSQASLEAKDPYSSHSAALQQSDFHHSELGQMGGEAIKQVEGEELFLRNQSTATHEPIQSIEHGSFPLSTGESVVLQDSQSRGESAIGGDDDDTGDVVKVRYPYDWEQVSEVLFGGTPDFFQLSTY